MRYRRYRSYGRLGRALALLTLLAVGVVAAAAVARAEDPGGGATTAPPETPPAVAAEVTVAGVPVGGLTAAEATEAVRAFYRERFSFRFGRKSWTRLPSQLGARPFIADAVAAALAAPSGSALPLQVSVDPARLRGFTRRVDRTYSRPVVNTTVRLRGLRPRLTRAHRGYDIRRTRLYRVLRHALANHDRGPIAVPYRVVRPSVTRSSYGAIIVIRRESKRLFLYDGTRKRRVLGVATGQPAYPTPLGAFRIVTKQMHPWWYPPSSDWAQGLKPVPPGPGNPLGTRWMGLSSGSVGIHGTPDAASIGYSASHGCIRMRIPDAEWVFDRVRVGTPVFIVSA